MRNYRKHVSRTTFAACCLLVSLTGKASGLPVPEKPDGIAVEESQSVLQTPAFSVKGVVIDSNTGEPLIGCTVKIKGSNQGAITDVNGEFNIRAKKGDMLEISYIGYTTK